MHWYDPVEHALLQIGPPAAGDVTTMVVTGVPWRTGWRYAERGWRHLYWDAGTVLSHLLAAAASAGLQPKLRTRFPDALVCDLVGADRVHEYPLAMVSLGDGRPAVAPSGPAATGTLPPIELPHATAAQRAGDVEGLGAPWARGASDAGDPRVRLVGRGGPATRLPAADESDRDAPASAP